MPPGNKDRTLERGEVYGAVVRTLHLDPVTLTETRYSAGAQLPTHVHALPMFVLVLGGSFDESFDRHQRTCGARQLLYRPAGERHTQRFLARGAACLTIEVPGLTEERGLSAADGRLPLAGTAALTSMRIYDELASPTQETPLIVEELTADLVADAARRPAVYERQFPTWLSTAREMIDATAGTPLRLGEIAASVGVHRVHLSRTFRRFFGCGIGDYVRCLRVHSACARLRGTRVPGSSIACEVGFSDESHMGRAFREVMCCAPREYRRRNAEEKQSAPLDDSSFSRSSAGS